MISVGGKIRHAHTGRSYCLLTPISNPPFILGSRTDFRLAYCSSGFIKKQNQKTPAFPRFQCSQLEQDLDSKMQTEALQGFGGCCSINAKRKRRLPPLLFRLV